MSLVSKLAEVMAAVERIPKRGRNDFHKYDYATEADIAATIRKELASRQIMLIPSVEGMQRDPVGDKGSVLTTLFMTFTFLDGESGETLDRKWLGAGTDKEDKGAYKAMTGGEKYFLLKTFLMPTGDDPEADDKNKATNKATVKPDAATRKARPAPPAGAVFIDKVVPRSRGNQEWAEVILSTGEQAIAHVPALITLATNIAQENGPVVLTTHANQKGHTEIDSIERWVAQPGIPPPVASAPMTASDITF